MRPKNIRKLCRNREKLIVNLEKGGRSRDWKIWINNQGAARSIRLFGDDTRIGHTWSRADNNYQGGKLQSYWENCGSMR